MFYSCGIPEDIPVLAQPGFGSSNNVEKYFTFNATEENSGEEFRGFEVYYRFFPYNTTNISDYLKYTTLSELQTYSFRRVTYYVNANDCDTPDVNILPVVKIPIDNRGNEAEITIHFGDQDNVRIYSNPPDYMAIPELTPTPTPEVLPEPTLPPPIPALPIRRSIEDIDNPGFYKGFDTYKTTDLDVINTGIGPGNPDIIIITSNGIAII